MYPVLSPGPWDFWLPIPCRGRACLSKLGALRTRKHVPLKDSPPEQS